MDISRSQRRIGVFHLCKIVFADKLRALRQSLRVTDDRPDIVERRARHRQEVMRHSQIIHAVDMQRPCKHQIVNLVHIASKAVLDRQHRTVARTADHRLISLRESAVSDLLPHREDAACRNMCKRALGPAVRDPQPLQKSRLIPPRYRHHILQKLPVIRLDLRVLDPRLSLSDDLGLALGIVDRQPVLPLIFRNLGDLLHPRFKQPRHPVVNVCDLFSDLFQIFHFYILLLLQTRCAFICSACCAIAAPAKSHNPQPAPEMPAASARPPRC